MIDLKLVFGGMHHVGDLEPALEVCRLLLQYADHLHDAVVLLLRVHARNIEHDVFLLGHLDKLELLPAYLHGIG